MSRSFKSEPARKAAQQRRDARHSKIEWRDKFLESPQPGALDKKTVVGSCPPVERVWTPPRAR